MKTRELKDVQRYLTVVLSASMLESGQRDRLRKSRRELEKIGRSGKPDYDRIFRVTEDIAKTLLEVVSDEEVTRWPR